jgi:zinc/manganese transport system permease protein
MLHFLAPAIVLSILLVGIHAYLGLHVLKRDVIFVDISLSQVAALGAALSLLVSGDENSSRTIGFSLFLCLLVSLGLSLFRKYEKHISQEAIIGITYAFASGALILVVAQLPHGDEHLKTAMIGNILFVSWSSVIETAIIYGIIGLVHFIFRRQFWAISSGERSSFAWDFLFYFLFGVVITFSTHHAGVLVVFSILVVPAALACRFARSIRNRLLAAWAFGVLSVLLSFYLSTRFDWPAGAGIVATLTSAFFLILIGRLIYEHRKRTSDA